jgi:hypothetical protein
MDGEMGVLLVAQSSVSRLWQIIGKLEQGIVTEVASFGAVNTIPSQLS